MSQNILKLNHSSPQLLQFTDLHLSDKEALMGINCDESFAATKALATKFHHVNLTLLTGDISQDHSEASYQKCREVFRNQGHPVAWITGNHDDLSMQNDILSDGDITPIKRIVFKHWQLVLLNSQLPGQVCGNLADEQLAMIESAASEYPEHHLMLVMHHHPVLMESQWIDNHRLLNSDELWQVIAKVPQVKCIMFGHVHQAVDVTQSGVRVLGCPSTSIQFTPKQQEFSVDTAQPGFRHLELLVNGSVKTQVHRVEGTPFIADFDPAGY
ncbi:3',5'-cyclic-AMP phosphodiesterase [Psychrobium sp. 1_MG-2023]|uniref:3',5'-cyclic-AMP phosphodiesterase n=1 Tax=Psychrobium sp. 1_MG-2023 TaxID=3062624 RepID=UPI000C33420B|nr:3',5'-cyclic-AMP phosphodiesterase [Psychrobium sp. 1_MG-2023]MDP2561219.1 3',5'-cyclic-AMP phosphodiesterase [Psychrobium sp. 1_MG-2023]PKF55277.1 3',5'-cyclic-AMP phosphodiesterase [Alteromonadales bacterium alter-6D02]